MPFTLCDTVKTCYEATNGEVTFELFLKVHLSTMLYWLWGKSPDLRQKVSIVKKHVFLESTSRVEATSQSWTREGHFVEAKLCKVTSIPDVELDGAYSHCVSPIFKSEKVNGQRFKIVNVV